MVGDLAAGDHRSAPPAYAAGLVTSGLQHTVNVQLRWRDMDMLGHLNQSVYHELLEEGRAALMTELVRRAGSDHSHGTFVLAHVDLDYHAEVRKDHQDVEIVVRVTDVGTSSLRLEHEVRLPDGTLAASGKTVLVAWDPHARRKRPLTEAERAALT
jgi:acyl-CoA thioester hydrolase